VELAEWGARLVEKGFLLEESDDNHPMAWQRIIDPEERSEVESAVTIKLSKQTRKHMAGFPGRSREIEGRLYISFSDYLKWKGRRNKGGLKSRMRTGLVVAPWNRWVEAQGGEGWADLAGVKVGKLSCYVDGYRFRVCLDAGELEEEMSRRESLLESLQVWKLDSSDDERFRQRVEHWKESALGFFLEIYTLSRALNSISQRYFDDQEASFPDMAEGFNQLLVSAKKLVGLYNEALAADIERLEKLLIEAAQGQDETPLNINLAELIEKAQNGAKEQVAYFVDTAISDALNVLGESRKAWELVDRYV